MNLKLIAYGLSACIIAFAAGRFTAPKNNVAQTKIETKKETDKTKQTKKTITETKEKDGTIKKITVIDSETNTKSREAKNESTKIEILPQYKVGMMFGHDHQKKATKGVLLGTQLYGNFDIGVYVMGNNTFGDLQGVMYLMLGF